MLDQYFEEAEGTGMEMTKDQRIAIEDEKVYRAQFKKYPGGMKDYQASFYGCNDPSSEEDSQEGVEVNFCDPTPVRTEDKE